MPADVDAKLILDALAHNVELCFAKTTDENVTGDHVLFKRGNFVRGPLHAKRHVTYGAYGEVYFEASTYLKKNTGDYLLQGLYRDSAIPPALNPDETIKVMLDYASRRINDIILPAGDISSDEATAVTDAIGALKATVTESAEFGMDEYGALVAAIAEIENESVRARITADIKYALMMSTVLNKELDLSDIPDAPEYIPPVNESEPEISDTESNAASDSSESSDNADNGDNGGNGNLAMYICFGILALCAVALAVFLIFRKK